MRDLTLKITIGGSGVECRSFGSREAPVDLNELPPTWAVVPEGSAWPAGLGTIYRKGYVRVGVRHLRVQVPLLEGVGEVAG